MLMNCPGSFKFGGLFSSLFVGLVITTVLLFSWSRPTRRVVNVRRNQSTRGSGFLYTDDDRQSLQYIPDDVVRTWRERGYLVVFAVLSPDNSVRRRRRYLQRLTCWRYEGVARRANNFTGSLLPTFVLARHPDHGYQHSPQLKEEGTLWQDIIALPINEGRVSTNKRVGQDGRYWGLDAEIGMSRKMYRWYELVLRLFPRVNYFAKCDDDMFLHTPQYLTDLRILPRRRLYWGNIVPARFMPLLFATGGLYTISRELAAVFVSYEPVKRLIDVPYSKEREEEFTSLYMQHEDLLMGRVLHDIKFKPLFVAEPLCRFHNLHGSGWVGPLTESSLLIHNVKEAEYATLRDFFATKSHSKPTRFKSLKGKLYGTCRRRRSWGLMASASGA